MATSNHGLKGCTLFELNSAIPGRTNKIVESTLRRHGYYCRTRKGHSSGVRARSCLACARAKARCDAKLSGCSRCATKGLHCRYPGDKTSVSATQRSNLSSQSANEKVFDPLPEGTAPSVANIEEDLASAENIDLDFDVTDIDRNAFSWELISTEATSTPDLVFSQQQPLLYLASTPSTSRHDHFPTPPYSPIGSLSAMPLYHLRAFARNPVTASGGANTTSILMTRILASYPMMLRDPTSPPPFIHPVFLNSEERSLESLNTCVSLIQMLDSGIQGSKKLVWKNIRLECERLQVQVRILLQICQQRILS